MRKREAFCQRQKKQHEKCSQFECARHDDNEQFSNILDAKAQKRSLSRDDRHVSFSMGLLQIDAHFLPGRQSFVVRSRTEPTQTRMSGEALV